MRGIFVLAGIALLSIALPGAHGADAIRTLYFHADGTLSDAPSSGRWGQASYAAPPAAEGFLLRAHAALYAREAGLIDGTLTATIYRNGMPIGTGVGRGELIDLLGQTDAITIDNPETTFAKGDVLSVRISQGGGLLGGAEPVSLVLTEAAMPAPAPAPTPASSPPVATPTPATVQTNPPSPSPAPNAGASAGTTPAASGGNTRSDGGTGAAPAVAPAAGAPDWLSQFEMPWENVTSALLLALVAATTLGAWSVVRLGRI